MWEDPGIPGKAVKVETPSMVSTMLSCLSPGPESFQVILSHQEMCLSVVLSLGHGEKDLRPPGTRGSSHPKVAMTVPGSVTQESLPNAERLDGFCG